MKERTVFSLILLLITFSLVGCAGNNTDKTTVSDGETKKLFTIRIVTSTGFDPILITDQLGYFREEGIEIKYTGALKGGATAIQTVLQGNNDVFSGHPPNVAQAVLAGAKIKGVATSLIDNPDKPHVAYLVREDSPIKSLKDIVGKKISQTSSTSPCQDGFLKLWLAQNNLPQSVEWVKLPNPGQQEQALRQGLVDVTTSHAPYYGMVLKQGGMRQIATSYDIVKTPGAGVSLYGFSEKFIQEHPDVVRGFCKALYKGRLWVNAHQAEASEIIAKQLNLDLEAANARFCDDKNIVEPSYIEIWFKIAEDLGMWQKGDIKPTDIYTNDFAPKD